MAHREMKTILHHIPTAMKHQCSTNGGEWAGACPWCGGTDRFRAWPSTDRFWCRRCGRSGDSIDLARDLQNLDFKQARELVGHELYKPYTPTKTDKPARLLLPPNDSWQTRALAFVSDCKERLWSNAGSKVLQWLKRRGFKEETILEASLGFNQAASEEEESKWGLNRGKPVFLDRGVVIPWFIDEQLWRVNIRRNGRPKYRGPAGYSNGLYRANEIQPGFPVIVTEGEFDALSVAQETNFTAVATGTISGSRKPKWIARLALAGQVLIAFDNDAAGEEAANFWLQTLPNSRRLKPILKDCNEMLKAQLDLRRWARKDLLPRYSFKHNR